MISPSSIPTVMCMIKTKSMHNSLRSLSIPEMPNLHSFPTFTSGATVRSLLMFLTPAKLNFATADLQKEYLDPSKTWEQQKASAQQGMIEKAKIECSFLLCFNDAWPVEALSRVALATTQSQLQRSASAVHQVNKLPKRTSHSRHEVASSSKHLCDKITSEFEVINNNIAKYSCIDISSQNSDWPIAQKKKLKTVPISNQKSSKSYQHHHSQESNKLVENDNRLLSGNIANTNASDTVQPTQPAMKDDSLKDHNFSCSQPGSNMTRINGYLQARENTTIAQFIVSSY
ncbi:uncharacterized protein PHACADRAFT_29226 [Phanerochaete carnosa HHB-10118-sp]|uniref:Uncharacterized protein n=1 Tax=Phanerochaete carnosa (strain HHB-10118-sp) TaxID=650164 RepID=K5W470_PHACS|nr:uncharacterized protein PHACADRAFT_29226 [Phanerochaete carnosa HHB-10118-sp]EKM53930.1 hypothetical protein PHACADRAFT_29226 [Phanerochaete carnosa HHB-10118-sp]